MATHVIQATPLKEPVTVKYGIPAGPDNDEHVIDISFIHPDDWGQGAYTQLLTTYAIMEEFEKANQKAESLKRTGKVGFNQGNTNLTETRLSLAFLDLANELEDEFANQSSMGFWEELRPLERIRVLEGLFQQLKDLGDVA